MLVECKTIGIVACVRAQEGEQAAGLLGNHLILQITIRKLLVPNDVDLTDFRFRPFVDLEHDIYAVLAELDHLWLDRRGEAPLTLVKLDNAGDICADLGASKDLARCETNFRKNLVILDSVVAFENDPVDHRVLDHIDDDITAFVRDTHARKEFSRGKVFDDLVTSCSRIGITWPKADVR